MSGITVSYLSRRRCPASGRDYTSFVRRGVPDEHHMLNCPEYGKRVTLAVKPASGKIVVIPRHLELVVGM